MRVRTWSIPFLLLLIPMLSLTPPIAVAASIAPAAVATTGIDAPFQIVSGELPAMFPADFPFPADYTIAATNDDNGALSVILNVPNAKAAYDFYKDALPQAGYQVDDEGAVAVGDIGFAGGLTFSNATYTGHIGGVNFGFTDTQTIGIDLTRR